MSILPSRGKRRLGWSAAVAWALLTIAALSAIVFGDLEVAELEALQGLYGTAATALVFVVVSLFVTDAVPTQILPAWKGKSND